MRQGLNGRRRPSRVAIAASVRAAVIVGVLLSGTACSSSTPSSGSTSTGAGTVTGTAANAAYCNDLQALSGNLDQLKALDKNTATADQVRTILTDAQSNLNQAAKDATGTATIKITAIKTAFSALTAALSALPTSVTATQPQARRSPTT